MGGEGESYRGLLPLHLAVLVPFLLPRRPVDPVTSLPGVVRLTQQHHPLARPQDLGGDGGVTIRSLARRLLTVFSGVWEYRVTLKAVATEQQEARKRRYFAILRGGVRSRVALSDREGRRKTGSELRGCETLRQQRTMEATGAVN